MGEWSDERVNQRARVECDRPWLLIISSASEIVSSANEDGKGKNKASPHLNGTSRESDSLSDLLFAFFKPLSKCPDVQCSI